MKIKVSEATPLQINYLAAKCEGEPEYLLDKPWRASELLPHYSTNWAQGGPIIDREITCIRKRSKAEEATLAFPDPNFKFKAEIVADAGGYFCGFGPTSLIAAMRCYVASRLGDEVDAPAALLYQLGTRQADQ